MAATSGHVWGAQSGRRKQRGVLEDNVARGSRLSQVSLGLPLRAQALLSWTSRCSEPQPETQGLGCPAPSLQGDEVRGVQGPDQVIDRWKTVIRSRQTSSCS